MSVASAAPNFTTPETQRALLLHAPKESYKIAEAIPVPALENATEVLIRIEAIGLNPIDWKSALYGFGLPTLPALNGRDLAGTVVLVGDDVKRWKVGDRVFGPSTTYRDYRTSAFQEYAVASEHCIGAVPEQSSFEECAAIGVGAVAAALAVGSALGIAVRGFAPRALAIGAEGESPEWIKTSGSPSPIHEPSAQFGEWILIWGGSTVTGYLAAQLARLAGLRVIAVADTSRHEARLKAVGVEHVVDRADTEAAIAEIRRITEGTARYAIDCIGSKTAAAAIDALSLDSEVFIVGLSGLPKEARARVRLCELPIKTFHANPAVGTGLMNLLEELIKSNEIQLPPVETIEGGLEAVNGGLDRLRLGEYNFGRLVVRTPHA